jgi:hypothetical protein
VREETDNLHVHHQSTMTVRHWIGGRLSIERVSFTINSTVDRQDTFQVDKMRHFPSYGAITITSNR